MECRVLHLKYDATGRPDIPGKPAGGFVVREDSKWWTVYGPSVERTHHVFCHLWEEAPGLFAVFAAKANWGAIDPDGIAETLPKYYEQNSDWRTCRYRGEVEVLRGDKTKTATIVGAVVVIDKPGEKPSREKPLQVGRFRIHEIWPSVEGSIGDGDRTIDAEREAKGVNE